DEARSRVCVLHFPAIPRPLEDILGGRAWLALKIRHDEARQVYELVRGALNASRHGSEGEALFLGNQALYAIATILARKLPGPDAASRFTNLVRRAIAWFEEHMHKAPTLDDLAHEHNCSKSTLHRAFAAAELGPPKHVFLERRMKRARLLLSTT